MSRASELRDALTKDNLDAFVALVTAFGGGTLPPDPTGQFTPGRGGFLPPEHDPLNHKHLVHMALAVDDPEALTAVCTHFDLRFVGAGLDSGQDMSDGGFDYEDGDVIHYAARAGAESVLTYFCTAAPTPEQNISPSARGFRSMTPLRCAVERVPLVSTARLLLDLGADINHLDRDGLTPLATLCFAGGGWSLTCPDWPRKKLNAKKLTLGDCKLACISLLLSRGATLNCRAQRDWLHQPPNEQTTVCELLTLNPLMVPGGAALIDYLSDPASRNYDPDVFFSSPALEERYGFVIAWSLLRRAGPAPPESGLGALPLDVVQLIAKRLWNKRGEPSPREIQETVQRENEAIFAFNGYTASSFHTAIVASMSGDAPTPTPVLELPPL